jgi:hypothetical protein
VPRPERPFAGAAAAAAARAPAPAADSFRFLDNGVVRLGIDL